MHSFFPPPSDRASEASLPPFQSLLVKGPYHTSAPIHLVLSFDQTHDSEDAPILMLFPSRDAYAAGLRQTADEWILVNSGRGNYVDVLSKTRVFYPPTPAHLSFLLSALHVPKPSEDKATLLHEKIVLEKPPALLVLAELSAYFLPSATEETPEQKWTVTSYMTLVSRTFSLISFLSTPDRLPARLVLFDSRIGDLRLPMFIEPSVTHNTRVEPVAILVQRFFEWTAVFEHDGMQETDIIRKRMKLYQGSSEACTQTTTWLEKKAPSERHNGAPLTHIIWDDRLHPS